MQVNMLRAGIASLKLPFSASTTAAWTSSPGRMRMRRFLTHNADRNSIASGYSRSQLQVLDVQL
jgi:hypothetical protein